MRERYPGALRDEHGHYVTDAVWFCDRMVRIGVPCDPLQEMSHGTDYGFPAGVAAVRICDEDGQALVAPDGGTNTDLAPMDPAMTYGEAVSFFSRLAVLPRMLLGSCGYRIILGEP